MARNSHLRVTGLIHFQANFMERKVTQCKSSTPWRIWQGSSLPLPPHRKRIIPRCVLELTTAPDAASLIRTGSSAMCVYGESSAGRQGNAKHLSVLIGAQTIILNLLTLILR